MYTGADTVEWLFHEQLQVDRQWSGRFDGGFTWWADRHAQRVAILGSEAGPDGSESYFLQVATDVLRDVDLDDKTAGLLNLIMMQATAAGPVYDPQDRSVRLVTLVRMHEGNHHWMRLLVSVAAMLQVVEAKHVWNAIAATMGLRNGESGHPHSGPRAFPDELAAGFPEMAVTAGRRPSAWQAQEFRQAEQDLQPAHVRVRGSQLSVPILCGPAMSTLRLVANEPHPRFGNGLFMRHSVPVVRMSDGDGARLAISLNRELLGRVPSGYGFGSCCYTEGEISFVGFIPNVGYRPGLLPNLVGSATARADAFGVLLANFLPPDVPPTASAGGQGIWQKMVGLFNKK